MANMCNCSLRIEVPSEQYKELRDFRAALVKDGCAGLLPIERDPSPETRQQWISTLADGYRKDHSEEETQAAIEQWSLPRITLPDGDGFADNLWCEWAIRTWGTLGLYRGAGDAPQTVEWSDTVLTHHFVCKYTPPHRWAKAIAKQYPEWHIKLECDSWESGHRGWIEWDGQRWTSEFVEGICMACGRVNCQDPCPAILTPRELLERNLADTSNIFGETEEELERQRQQWRAELAMLERKDEAESAMRQYNARATQVPESPGKEASNVRRQVPRILTGAE